MKIQVETILNENSTKLLNTALTYTNTFRTLNEVVMELRKKIHSLNLHKTYDCGKGASHIWLSRLSDGERILLITK